MLGAFLNDEHFPIPDLLMSSVGAVCDDFSVVAQRLESLGHRVVWWEIPARREPSQEEAPVDLPGGLRAPREQVDLVKSELGVLRRELDRLSGRTLTDRELTAGIAEANRIRGLLAELRELVFTAPACPLPALELLIAEMLALHFCSDRAESARVLQALLDEVRRRVNAGRGVLPPDAVRIFWVNPVADLRVMNVLEECGGRLCGTELLFCHAIEPVMEGLAPMEALARSALADPMVGPVADRARRIIAEAKRVGSDAVVVSRIPGASHCAWEGAIIAEDVRRELDLPVIEIEVPPVSDAVAMGIRGRLEALIESVRAARA
jgi:benzoyl-CoA reductase/2-hydroxyglutaryl-CoA dehydratase subunit BcrC/BadD/HgdB